MALAASNPISGPSFPIAGSTAGKFAMIAFAFASIVSSKIQTRPRGPQHARPALYSTRLRKTPVIDCSAARQPAPVYAHQPYRRRYRQNGNLKTHAELAKKGLIPII